MGCQVVSGSSLFHNHVWVLNNIGADQEEGCFDLLLIQERQEAWSRRCWAIIKRQSPDILVRTLDHIVVCAVLTGPVTDTGVDLSGAVWWVAHIQGDRRSALQIDLS